VLKNVMYGVSVVKNIGIKCIECGSAKIGYDPHGIKFCKDCGIVVEEWMNE